MRTLIPSAQQPRDGQTSDEPDLHAHYGHDWLDVGGVRANFVCSVDGAVTASGLSRGLQTPGDNRVFAALRDLADVVLVGARTATAEGYRALRRTGKSAARRTDRGLHPQLPIALVSRSLVLDPAAELFTAADPSARTIVLTCAGADPSRRAALAQVADVIDCGEQELDLAAACAALRARGLRRILCEGGPSLLASLAAAGLLDELCLSVSPLLTGPGAGRIVTGSPWPDTLALRLVGLLEEDGAFFSRYAAAGRPPAG